jgi:SAM-dependent methyltransferase
VPKPYRAIADYYDAEYEHSPMLQRDVPFFLGHLPGRSRFQVLDVACGTARASIPIAQAGHRVIGIDYAKDMLDIAACKRDYVGLTERQLELQKQDARNIRIDGARFDWAAVFFNTFLSFVTLADQDAVLQGIHRHLRTRGRLWLDIFQPNLDILARPESKNHDPSVFWVPNLERTVQRTVDIRRDPSKAAPADRVQLPMVRCRRRRASREERVRPHLHVPARAATAPGAQRLSAGTDLRGLRRKHPERRLAADDHDRAKAIVVRITPSACLWR